MQMELVASLEIGEKELYAAKHEGKMGEVLGVSEGCPEIAQRCSAGFPLKPPGVPPKKQQTASWNEGLGASSEGKNQRPCNTWKLAALYQSNMCEEARQLLGSVNENACIC